MNKIETLIFKPDHTDLIELRPHDKANIDLDMFKSLAYMDAEKAQMQTLVADGRIIAIIGYMQLWPGVLEVFVLPSIYIPQHPVAFVRKIRRYLKSLEHTLDTHRIQSTARADDDTTRWMIALGFAPEGFLKKYTRDKSNYVMWARVR